MDQIRNQKEKKKRKIQKYLETNANENTYTKSYSMNN